MSNFFTLYPGEFYMYNFFKLDSSEGYMTKYLSYILRKVICKIILS